MSQGFTVPGIRDNQVTDAKLRDSAALSVIGRSANSSGDPADIAGATVGHVLQVLSGPTVGFGAAPIGTAVYNPDAGPTGTWGDEEFAGGAEALTWRWGNQGSSTQTLVMDASILYTPSAATNHRVRWTTPPTGSFFAVMKFGFAASATNNLGGLCVLETGTEASPTSISSIGADATTGGSFSTMYFLRRTSYTAAYYTATGYMLGTNTSNASEPYYWAVSYKASTNRLQFWWSGDGMIFRTDDNFSLTLGADPVSIGYFVDPNSGGTGPVMIVHYFRIWNSEIQTYLEPSTSAARTAYAVIGS